jgi:hypothetical protein
LWTDGKLPSTLHRCRSLLLFFIGCLFSEQLAALFLSSEFVLQVVPGINLVTQLSTSAFLTGFVFSIASLLFPHLC